MGADHDSGHDGAVGGRLQNPAVNTDDDETEIERAARSLSLPEEREALLGVSERES